MSEGAFFAAVFFPSTAAAVIFSMKYIALIVQARSHKERDDLYREMAIKATTAQSEMAAAVLSLSAEVAEIKNRLSVIEKILKDVE